MLLELCLVVCVYGAGTDQLTLPAIPRDSSVPSVSGGVRNAVRFTLLSLRRSKRRNSQSLQRKQGRKHTERTQKGAGSERVANLSLCKHSLSSFLITAVKFLRGRQQDWASECWFAVLYFVSLTHLGILDEMVNNLHYLTGFGVTYETPLLGMSLRLCRENPPGRWWP